MLVKGGGFGVAWLIGHVVRIQYEALTGAHDSSDIFCDGNPHAGADGERSNESAREQWLCRNSARTSGPNRRHIAGAVIVLWVGGPIGDLVGLLADMLVQDEMNKSTTRLERKELGEEFAVRSTTQTSEPTQPPLGEPARVWGDEMMKNGRLISGSFNIRHLP